MVKCCSGQTAIKQGFLEEGCNTQREYLKEQKEEFKLSHEKFWSLQLNSSAKRKGNMKLGELDQRKKGTIANTECVSPGRQDIGKEFVIICRPASAQKTDFPHIMAVFYWFSALPFTYC